MGYAPGTPTRSPKYACKMNEKNKGGKWDVSEPSKDHECSDKQKCTCKSNGDTVHTQNVGVDACKNRCLANDDCKYIYCMGDNSSTCECFEYTEANCKETETPEHYGEPHPHTLYAKEDCPESDDWNGIGPNPFKIDWPFWDNLAPSSPAEYDDESSSLSELETVLVTLLAVLCGVLVIASIKRYGSRYRGAGPKRQNQMHQLEDLKVQELESSPYHNQQQSYSGVFAGSDSGSRPLSPHQPRMT